MKSKLLGLLGILTLISRCSNVNQKSLDPEEVVTSESKTYKFANYCFIPAK